MTRRLLPSLLTVSAMTLGLVAAALVGGPAVADSQSPATCITGCTAVFDTAGASGTFVAPTGITSLTVTVSGAAGAQATTAESLAASSVGGPGGSTTVDLGSGSGGVSYGYTVGNTGDASSVSSAGSLLVVAGAGGQAGYIGRLDLADQIFGTSPGGTGGSPTGPGVFAGTDGTTPNGTNENGHGGAVAAGGAAGTGDTNGTAGTAPNTTSIVAGGAGASEAVVVTPPGSAMTFSAGSGGSGYSGGGGGAITRNLLDGDGNPYDVVGAGGGGSGFLATGFTATANPANPATGSVTFTYSFSPTITTTATTVHRGDTVPTVIAGLPASVAFSVVFDGVTVGTGTSGLSGGATLSFAVASTQVAGSFPMQLVVGGTVAASTTNVTVVVAGLASTGSVVPLWLPIGAGAVVVLGVLLIVMRRRFAPGRARH